jgi:arabinofuranosyltransferase
MAIADRTELSGARDEPPRPHRWDATAPAVLITLAFSAAFIVRTAFTYHGRTYFSLFDDSMISMTYGRNLAEGHGLVWNAGGERVEGYTNLLWTLWMAGVHAVGVSDARSSLVVMVTGVALLVAHLFVVRAIARHLAPEAPRVAQLSVLLTALLYPLLFWTLRGMEVGLLTLLVSLAILLALRISERPQRADVGVLCAVLGAGVLTRDDSITWAAVIVAFIALRARSGWRWPAATLVVVLAAKTGFRVAYYGEALPNTYTLKLGGIPLGVRLHRGLVAVGNIGLVELFAPLALAVVALVYTRRDRLAPLLLPAAVFAVQCAYCVYVGGDVWETFDITDRYLTPALPALLVLAAVGAHRLVSTGSRAALVTIAGVLGATALANLVLTQSVRAQAELLRLGPLEDRTGTILVGAALAACAVALALARKRGGADGRVTFAVAGVLLLVAVNGPQLAGWAADNADYSDADAAMSRYGLLIGEVTPPRTTIAVTWAGAIPYFARRDSVDVLGKSDRVVARSAPQPVPFAPGHDKWDYSYSLGRLRPALVTQLWYVEPGLPRQLRSWGYSKIATFPLPLTIAQLYATRALPPEVRNVLRRRISEVARDS